jgi:D-alanine--poly(phosphoribitol) ligase subunit 1
MSATPFQNLWQSFEATADRNHDQPALIFAAETIGFGQLRSYVESTAQWLADRGLKCGDVVALQIPKRLETYLLWLACLRQGLPYVFIDPKNPDDRTSSILARTRPALFITGHRQAYAPDDIEVMATDADWQAWLAMVKAVVVKVAPAVVTGMHPAYIMFTSGSTGEPKGAVIPHQGVMWLMAWARNLLHTASRPTFSNLNPLHFDNSVFDLYCGLLNGASLVPVETGSLPNPMAWVRRLRDAHATVIFAVPTLFLTLDKLKLLTPESLPDARYFLFGGEGFPIEALKAFHRRFETRARLINVYGPTETSCICSSQEIDQAQLAAAGDGFASLGHMHIGFDHLVLDDDGGPTDLGELWIGGPCVGLGYYSNPAETQKRFCQDPRQDFYRSVWYRTGDLVRVDERGQLWFRGRVDNQVKIRGHRIELEEIDLAAEQMPGVRRASCVAITGADGLELRLAYVADHQIQIDDMRAHCWSRLPTYMRPAVICQLEHLPENANGKVDRKAVRVLLAGVSA